MLPYLPLVPPGSTKCHRLVCQNLGTCIAFSFSDVPVEYCACSPAYTGRRCQTGKILTHCALSPKKDFLSVTYVAAFSLGFRTQKHKRTNAHTFFLLRIFLFSTSSLGINCHSSVGAHGRFGTGPETIRFHDCIALCKPFFYVRICDSDQLLMDFLLQFLILWPFLECTQHLPLCQTFSQFFSLTHAHTEVGLYFQAFNVILPIFYESDKSRGGPAKYMCHHLPRLKSLG